MEDITVLVLAIMIFGPSIIINGADGRVRFQFSGIFLVLMGYLHNLFKGE
ncbi:hypothetical protein [Enterococcus hailinensis]